MLDQATAAKLLAAARAKLARQQEAVKATQAQVDLYQQITEGSIEIGPKNSTRK